MRPNSTVFNCTVTVTLTNEKLVMSWPTRDLLDTVCISSECTAAFQNIQKLRRQCHRTFWNSSDYSTFLSCLSVHSGWMSLWWTVLHFRKKLSGNCGAAAESQELPLCGINEVTSYLMNKQIIFSSCALTRPKWPYPQPTVQFDQCAWITRCVNFLKTKRLMTSKTCNIIKAQPPKSI